MLAVTHAGCLVGIDAHPVRVEVQLGKGLPGFDIVGLPERTVRESRVRVTAALDAAGFDRPKKNLVLNLAPGELRKSGSAFDVAIALAVLVACGRVPAEPTRGLLLLGELSLDGGLRPIRGVLAQLRSGLQHGFETAVVPPGNAAEAALVDGLDVRCAKSLGELVRWLQGEGQAPPSVLSGPADAEPLQSRVDDLADVRGQEATKRALEIAAAGGHHALLVGPPGSGKTMLARRLPGIMPPPSRSEALDIASIAGVAGQTPPGRIEQVRRPFRAPHHSASTAALVGGGDPVRPGEVTLAHGGVLFLDELPEFRRDVIESLRATMEYGQAVIARARWRVQMPAAPLIVAAMNPCPCGYEGDPRRMCKCTPDRVHRYRARVSGPLLDRFDLHVSVPRVRTRALRNVAKGESSAQVRARVTATRRLLASARDTAGGGELLAATEPGASRMLERAIEKLGLSARAYFKVLRVARTIAAMEGGARIEGGHVAEAIQYRSLDRDPAGASGTHASGTHAPPRDSNPAGAVPADVHPTKSAGAPDARRTRTAGGNER